MAFKIIWSPEAADDLEAIVNYISRDSESIAARVAQRVVGAIDRLEIFPLSGPFIREWKKTRYRHLVVSPYRVIYRAEREAVFIIAIVHGARDLKRLMKARPRK